MQPTMLRSARRVADQTTRTEVLQEIRNRSREHMSPADLQRLDQAEAKIDQMLRDRQDAADRARNAGQRYVNRACEILIATASRGFFQCAGGDSSKTVAAAPAVAAATDGAQTDDMRCAPRFRAIVGKASRRDEEGQRRVWRRAGLA